MMIVRTVLTGSPSPPVVDLSAKVFPDMLNIDKV